MQVFMDSVTHFKVSTRVTHLKSKISHPDNNFPVHLNIQMSVVNTNLFWGTNHIKKIFGNNFELTKTKHKKIL